ncbi:MAG: hypothetical protein JRH20_03180 [Deltaproteobacteria bacterium]|nr:hypothetical protein [Deltaproteobacteria bacterium]
MQMTKAALVCALLTFPACGSKKQLDQSVTQLRVAAESGNYEAFKAITHPLLWEKFPASQLTRVSKALRKLGVFKERTMRHIKVEMGNKRKGDYTLRYEKGSVALEISVVQSKIVSFNFTGDDLAKSLQAVSHAEKIARYANFEVGHFTFLDRPGGKDRRNNIFQFDQPIAFRLRVHGLKLVNDTIFFVTDLKVTKDGKTVFSRPNFAGSDKPIPTKGLPVGTLTGTIRLPKEAGTYIAHFKVTDRHAKRSLNHQQAMVLQP